MQRSRRKRVFMLIVALSAALLLTSMPRRVSTQGTATSLGATLSTTQEIPLVETPSGAGGSATVTVSADATEITYTLDLTGPFSAAPTAAHIHLAPPGEPGPIVFFLCAAMPPQGVTAQACPDINGGSISGTLTAADLQAGAPTFADAVAAILDGDTYINVHTSLNQSGEIRGQVGPATLDAVISSAQEIPAVTTPSSAIGGSATISLNAAHDEITYEVDLVGPFTGEPALAHIHLGAPGVAGGVIFFLCATTPPPGVTPQVCPGVDGGPISGTLAAGDIQLAGMTMAQAVDALLSGRTYINVHTAANMSGEVRGQIGLAKLAADLNSAQEVPAVTTPSTASGAAMVTLNGSQTAIAYSVALMDPLTGPPTAAHIHLGPRGESGEVLLFLCANMPPTGVTAQMCPADGSPIMGRLTEADIQGAMITMDNVINALLSNGLYVNVHTAANPSGEIRGQIDPKPEGVSFANQVQLIYTSTCAFAGCHAGPTPAANMNLEVGMAYLNLVGQPSTQTLSDGVTRLNRVEPNAPDMSYLFKKHRGDDDISGQRMPRGNPGFFDLRTDLLEIERRWILEGALDN